MKTIPLDANLAREISYENSPTQKEIKRIEERIIEAAEEGKYHIKLDSIDCDIKKHFEGYGFHVGIGAIIKENSQEHYTIISWD